VLRQKRVVKIKLYFYVYIVIATIFRTNNFIPLPFVFVTSLFIVFSFEEYMFVGFLLLKTGTWCSFYDMNSTRTLHFTFSIKQIMDIIYLKALAL